MRKFLPSLLTLGTVAAAIVISVAAPLSLPSASATCNPVTDQCGLAAQSFAPVAYSTSACSSGRTCYNNQTVNACSSSCRLYNASGSATQWAARDTTTGSDIFFNGQLVWQYAQRVFNFNSGSGRDVCSYHFAGFGGTGFESHNGGGWAALPYTGVASHAAIPFNWVCN